MSSTLLEPSSLAGIAARSFILLLLTAGIGLAFRRRSAAFLHGVWTVGLAGCMAIPVIMSLSLSWALPLLPPQSNAVALVATAPVAATPTTAAMLSLAPVNSDPFLTSDSLVNAQQTSEISTTRPPAERMSEPHRLSAAARVAAERAVLWPTMETVALSLWGAGFLAVLLRLLQQLVAVRRKSYQAKDLDNADWRDQREVAARLLGLRADVSLKWHSDSLSPMVIGLLKPVVLLPDDADKWSPDKRHLVLLHEFAHVQRRDVLTQLMATLVCAVYWFNPLTWWGAAQMKRLREIACDDAVVTHSNAAAAYAQTLLDVAKRYRCRPTNAVAMARSSDVEARITAILSSTRNRTKLTPRSMRVLAAVAVVVATIVGTCQLISHAQDSTERAADLAADPEAVTEPRTMQVQVLDEAGQPLSGANVHVSIWEMDGARNYANRDYVTDELGRADVARPQRLQIMRLWPAKDGYVPMFVNFSRVEHEVGQLIPDEYKFRLQTGQRLSGRVVDPQGDGVLDANVQVQAVVKEPAWGVNPDAMINPYLASGDNAAVTDADGRWSINNAPARRETGKKDFEFRLQVTHPKFAGDTRWGELQQKQGITTADLRSGDATLVLDPGAAVAGQVTAPDGEPVRKGLVLWSDHPYWAEGVNETQIDELGQYETARLAPGKYPITVLAPGFAPWQNTLDINRETGDLNIQLEPGHPIRIAFVDPAGTPIANTRVGIAQWRGAEAIYNTKHPNVPDSGIPDRVNEDGVYRWDWAPDDAVKYRISADGFAPQEVTLVAKPTPHVITLAPRRVVQGAVTDAATGNPVESFLAMPVIVFRQDYYHTIARDAKVGLNGRYELPLTGSGDPSVRYRVRFEAEGYRSIVSDQSFGPLDGQAALDVALEPAPLRRGRVVDADGQPVAGATILEASPTVVPTTGNGKPKSFGSRPIASDAQGYFQLHATTERVRIRAYHDLGFTEQALAPDETTAGVLKLQPWASVSGRLLQAGRPVADQAIYFAPLVGHGLTEARFQDSYDASTDKDGNFQFDRISPIAGTLRTNLGPWQESPLTSSESIPLELHPGEHREVVLGGDGATVTGRVIATGRSNDELSKQWSLNYLVSRDHGVDYPSEAAALSFRPSGSLQSDWLRQPDFQSWMATRRNHFVKLSDDGLLNIHGVASGDYDLVIQLYEQPAGCLVETIGEKIVTVSVTAEQAATGRVAIGNIEVPCRIGPRVGTDMRAFSFTDASGQVRHIDDMQGKFVLFHVWATWCEPCIASMPRLTATVERYSETALTVIGLNIDEDRAAAQATATTQKMQWAQNYLGADSDLMRQLAISSVPAYYLIGSDGKLIGSANQWETIEQLLPNTLD